jgi:tripartite-type tricarboxylate transporter receptor subunit TctC
MRKLGQIITIGAALLANSAHAGDWPAHLIKATIPFGAGSAADVVPRLVFDRLAAELGQPIVIENRAGAGGTIGAASAACSERCRSPRPIPTATPCSPTPRR